MDTSAASTPPTTDRQIDSPRELSPTERWYWIIDQLSTLNVCARVRIEGELSTRMLRSGLDALQAGHSLLRLAIAEGSSGSEPHFVPTDNPIPLREVDATHPGDAHWVHEVDSHEFVESIDWRSGPLARAVVINQPGQVHDLVVTVPHCIADGTTVLALLRQWVRYAAEPPTHGPSDTDGTVPLPADALLPAHHLDSSEDMPDQQSAGAGDPDPVVGRLEPDHSVPFHLRRTRLLHRSLDGDTLEKLTVACKREGVTLHGVLAAAMASAVAHDAGAPPPTHFAVGSPVSFREELAPPVSEEDVGCYVSAIHSAVAYQPDDLWSMARSVNRDIAGRKQRGEHFSVFGLLAQQGPTGVADCEPFVQYIEEHGSFNFFVSNIGRFDFPDTVGLWRLSGAQFVGGISVVGYFASSVSTCHGNLYWNFTYIDEAVSQERAERLADHAVEIVRAAVS